MRACLYFLTLVTLDHLAEPKLAGALTAFVQGIGFIITVSAPSNADVLDESTSSFQSVWPILIVTLVAMLFVTMEFIAAGYSKAMDLTVCR